MVRINLMSDYGVPAAVGVGELMLRAIDRARLKSNPAALEIEPFVPYMVGIGGTAARMLGFLPRHDEKLRMAVAAAMPGLVTGMYEWLTTAAGAGASAGASAGARARASVRRIAATPVRQLGGQSVSQVPQQAEVVLEGGYRLG